MERETNKPDYNLQERLIDYAVRIINLIEKLPDTRAGRHVADQLLRSGTSPAPNYGEAQGAESRADFIHKMKISLKELRESYVWLKIIQKSKMIVDDVELTLLIKETNELISIFFTSIDTAKKNRKSYGN